MAVCLSSKQIVFIFFLRISSLYVRLCYTSILAVLLVFIYVELITLFIIMDTVSYNNFIVIAKLLCCKIHVSWYAVPSELQDEEIVPPKRPYTIDNCSEGNDSNQIESAITHWLLSVVCVSFALCRPLINRYLMLCKIWLLYSFHPSL